MSDRFEEFREKWIRGHITKATLKGYVALNNKKPGRGITAEEYQDITGEEY